MKYWNKKLKEMSEYIPGEQPQDLDEYIKLNTNENPYPPPSETINAIKDALDERLRLYPDPTCLELRKLISSVYLPEYNSLTHINNVMVGLGSDEIIDLLFKAFIDPGDFVTFFNPSYGMYAVLSEFYSANTNVIDLTEDFEIPVDINASGKIFFIDSPNNPSGKIRSNELIALICEKFDGLVVVDEAYADFSSSTALPLLKKHKNLAVMRTLSKGYSLASQRIGFIVADAKIIKILNEVKLPYNLPYLSQIAGIAAIKNMRDQKANNEKIQNERSRMISILTEFGIKVLPTESNFLFISMDESTAMKIFWELKDRKILVRHFNKKGLYRYLRVSVGTVDENNAFLEAFKEIAAKYIS